MTGPSCLVQWQLSGSARCEGIVGWTLQDWQFFLTRGGKTFTYLIQAHKSPILEGPVGKNVIEIGYNFSDIFGGTEYLCIYSQACSSGPSVARSKSPKSSMLGNGNLGPRSGGTPSNHSTYQESSKRKSLDANEQIHHFCCSFLPRRILQVLKGALSQPLHWAWHAARLQWNTWFSSEGM